MSQELDYTEFYGLRVLVFMETAPQSNKYHQILLTPKMYKEMTATICRPTGKMVREGVEEQSIQTSEEEYALPDLQVAYSEVVENEERL